MFVPKPGIPIYDNVVDNSPNTVKKINTKNVISGGVITNDYNSGSSYYIPTQNYPVYQNIQQPSYSPQIITTPKGQSLNNIRNKLDQINWSRSYLWDVTLPDLPPPFNDFFPAIEVEDAIAIGNSYSFDAGIHQYRFPWNKTYFDVKIIFMDDEVGTMEQYFEKWFFQIYTDNGVNYLSESVKLLTIKKLTSKHEILFDRKYFVYPEGTLYGINKSSSDVRMYAVDLLVAGYCGKD